MRKLVVPALLVLVATGLSAEVHSKDVSIAAPDGVELRLTHTSPGRPGPGVVLLHMCNSDRKAWSGLAEELAELWAAIEDEGGISALLDRVRAAKGTTERIAVPPEASINLEGYRRIGEGDTAGAIEILTLNVEAYASSANTLDSLGDAYLAAGNLAEAARYARLAIAAIPADPSIDEAFGEAIRQSAEAKLARAADSGSGAAAWTAPRLDNGQPDLQGVWANNSATPFERPKAFAGKEALTDQEVAELRAKAKEIRDGEQAGNLLGDFLIQKVLEDPEFRGFDQDTGNYNSFWLVEREFDNRTSVVVDPADGRLPPLTEVAKQRFAERAEYRRQHPADGPEDFSLGHRCVNFGIPKVGAGYNSYQQIFQTDDHVAILSEMAHDARVIPVDGRGPLSDDIRQWNGVARGRFDGDTLVVETRNFSAKSQFRGAAENLTIVERYTRTSDDILTYEVTVTDPTTWARPWTGRIPLQRSADAIFEYACHEGNYALEGSLRGARVQEAEGD